jgi:acetylornithine/N-succinyldiaminopimelate aminotransferase
LVNCTQGNVIRLLPPLVITGQELDAALAILRDALKMVFP